MKILLVLAVILAVSAARPSWSNVRLRKDNHKALSNVFGQTSDHQRRQVASGTCEQLSAAAADLVTEAKVSLEQMFTSMGRDVDVTQIVHSLSELSLGFDFLEDDAERDNLYCSAVSATSIAELKDILDNQHDYNYRVLRTYYGAASVGLMLAYHGISQIEDERAKSALWVVYQWGLVTMDMEATTVVAEVVSQLVPPEFYSGFLKEGETVEGVISSLFIPVASGNNLEVKCRIIQDLVNDAVRGIPKRVAMQFYMATGVDLTDREQTDRLICDIIASAPEGLRSVYEVLDNEGIVLTFYEFYMTMMQQFVNMWIPQLQMMIMTAETGEAGGPPEGAPNGPFTGNVKLLRLALAYLQEVEASGMLYLQ